MAVKTIKASGHLSKGTVIKHPPTLYIGQLVKQSTILVSTKTPFMSAFKRASKEIDRIVSKSLKRKYVALVGLGRSMDLVLKLGLKFQDEGYTIDTLTCTEYAYDETIDTEDDSKAEQDQEQEQKQEQEREGGGGCSLTKRPVCKVEVRVFAKKT